MSGGPSPCSHPGNAIQWARDFHHFLLGCMQRLFGRIGLSIGRRPKLFLVTSVFVFVSLATGSFNIRFAQRLQDGFVDRNSLARVEQAVHAQFHNEEHIANQRFVILIRTTPKDNILRRDHMRNVRKVFNFVRDNLTAVVDGRSYTHADLCGKTCDPNGLLWKFIESVEGVYSQQNVLVDHPQFRLNGRNLIMAHHVFGITRKTAAEHQMFDSTTESPQHDSFLHIPLNGEEHRWPVESNRTALKEAKMISLYYGAAIADANITNIVTAWETAVFEWSKTQTEFPEFRIDVMGDKILGQEMVRGGMGSIVYLAAGIVCTYCVVTLSICTMSDMVRKNGWTRTFAIITCLVASPLLACATTFGTLGGLLQIEIYPNHMVIPFLILAIGVDDAFLMIHSWDRISSQYSGYRQVPKAEIPALIFGKVMEESGPSITITSLTNAIAFLAGIFVGFPAMQVFCIYATLAIVLDFFLEIVMFGAVLVLTNDIELSDKPLEPSRLKLWMARFIRRYSKFLVKNSTRVAVMGITLVFFLVSLYGTLTIETQIDSQKIIPHDSRLLEADLLFKNYYWKEYEPLYIYVNSPPDISNATALRDLRKMISDFEQMPRSLGNKSTMLWLNDYQEMYGAIDILFTLMGGDNPLSTAELPFFLEKTDASAYNDTIKWHRDESGKVVIDQFMFMTGTHNATTWVQRAQNMLVWREIAANWSAFNVTVFSENSAVFEGIFGLAGTTIQTAVLTLVTMVAVCLFFVPSIIGVCVSALSISNISLGVVGFLSISRLNLDPVTMSAMVMSIGFSVDYTAHVSYHFQHSWSQLPKSVTPEECIEYTLTCVGLPMIQAAISTVACFVPVAFHEDYTPTVFLRTICFVVLFGVIHGLLILPTLLAMIPRSAFIIDCRRPQTKSFLQSQPLPSVVESKPTEPSETDVLVEDPEMPGIARFEPARITPLPSDTASSNSSNDTNVSLLTADQV